MNGLEKYPEVLQRVIKCWDTVHVFHVLDEIIYDDHIKRIKIDTDALEQLIFLKALANDQFDLLVKDDPEISDCEYGMMMMYRRAPRSVWIR